MMTQPLLTLSRGDSLNAWALSPVEAQYFPGEPALANDPQNYRYINGFVDVGDLPCRTATWRDVATRTVTLRTDWPIESLYLPGRSRAVEFSQFRHRPMRLARWCRTHLAAPADRYCSFRLSTRGGVHIWVDGELAGRFEPFTRNTTQHTIVHLPIKSSGSDIVVLTEDMAERDVIWFFEMTLLDDVSLDLHLPGADLGNGGHLLSELASQVRPRDEVSGGSEPVVLLFDKPAETPVTIRAEIVASSHTHATLFDQTFVLPVGETELYLCRAGDLPDGYHGLNLVLSTGGSTVERSIAVAILHQTAPQRLGDTLAERKAQALRHAAQHGEMRMGTAVALLEIGAADDPRVRAILEDTLIAIEERRDCSDFVAVPLLWALMRHGPHIPGDLAARCRRSLLDYRYWVDEPGNDVMWFWSENHALCFHVSQLLAGLLWPTEHFTTSGRTGDEQAALASARLEKWFDAVEEDGLAEWNSAAYYPVDFIGLLALSELAPNHLATRANSLCDRIFTMVALHTLAGVPAGSMGRAYDKELRAGPLTELAPFAAVAFGKGWLNKGVASLPLLAAGRYQPPDQLMALVDPPEGQAVLADYRQGFCNAALLSLYKTGSIQLSTNGGARPGGNGHQQHVLDLRFASHPMARSWINHPGEDDPWGQRRPSYWAGNGSLPRVGQHGNIAMLMYRLDLPELIDFTHVFASRSGLEHHLEGETLFLTDGRAHVAYKALGAIQAVESGPGSGLEYRCYGKVQGWAVVVAETQSLDAFRMEMAATQITMTPGASTLVLESNGRSLSLDWARGLAVNGAYTDNNVPPSTPRVRFRTLN